MPHIKLSIILPCYNVASYLSRCFDSIFSQDVDYNYEVVAVNDASTDNTLEILLLHASKNKNLLIINKKMNGKLSGARTTGIQNSCGEYIIHMDPDDYLLPNSLNLIFNNKEKIFDLKIFNILVENKDSNKKPSLLYPQKLPTIFNLNIKKDSKLFFKTFIGACYAKVIHRSIIEKLYYYDFNYNVGEDIAFNFEVFNRCKFVYFDFRPIYYYCFNKKSLVRGDFNIDRLNINQSWIANVKEVIQNQGHIYKNSKHYTLRIAERYTVGLLLQISKIQPSNRRSTTFNKWKSMMYLVLIFTNTFKKKIYNLAMKIPNERISLKVILILLGQIDPYIERLKRLK